MASQVNKVRNALHDGKPFLTKGKLDKTKLVDITRLDAKTSQQNPATTYTVENLLELKDNGLWDEFQDAIWNAGNGFYEDYYEDDEEYGIDGEDDEEFEVDGEYDEDDEKALSTAENVDISDYTPRFRYLYNYAEILKLYFRNPERLWRNMPEPIPKRYLCLNCISSYRMPLPS